MSAEPDFKFGTVAMVGRPNAGKSTILNALVGQKVSIVSSKPQTTRRTAVGIANGPNFQIAFYDTPGIHEPHNKLGRAMVESARRAVSDVDAVLVVIDCSKAADEEMRRLAKALEALNPTKPRIICLNKMDLLPADLVVQRVDEYCALFRSETYMLTTATRQVNLDKLVDLLVAQLPAGPAHYSEDEFTDQPLRLMVSEIIRERVILRTRQEVPHATAVMVDDWQEEPELTRISATVLVEKPGQRAILIGKGGECIRAIGTEARVEIEELVGKKIFLELHVKVSDAWRMNPARLRELSYLE